MASSSSATSTSLPRPRDLGGHRSVTLPARLHDASPASTPVRASADDIETLFESPMCKIVSFAPAIPSTRFRTVSLEATGVAPPPIGELPYVSNTERMIALGALRVYRVPGSVAFLNSGKLVHPVLPRSACWCVDGKTKFVLGVPGNKYYRIELPCDNENDQAMADEFKLVLAKISHYETTACPFKRGFHVELPEMDPTKIKRPWKPRHTPGVISPWSPEGQHLADGVQPERLFASSSRREEDQDSPRRQYASAADDIHQSRSQTTTESDPEEVTQPTLVEQRVPRLVATYDELAPGLGTNTLPDGSQLLESLEQNNHSDPTKQQHQLDENNVISDNSSLHSRRSEHIVREGASDTHERLKVQSSSDDKGSMHPSSESAGEKILIRDENASDGESQSLAELTNRDIKGLSAHAADHTNPLGIMTPPRLNTQSKLDTSDWLGIDENEDTPTALRPSSVIRATTAPILGSLSPDMTGDIGTRHIQRLRHNSEAQSLASVESTSSFHSFHSPTSPVLASPISDIDLIHSKSNKDLQSSGSPNMHKRETSSNTIRANTADSTQEDISTPHWSNFPPQGDENSTDEDCEAGTESDTKSYITATSPVSPRSPSPEPPLRQVRSKSPSSSLRVRLRRRRTHSPMPAAANIYIPPSTLSGHLTNAILQKTANLLLGPPVQLVALMLNLARRFAAGKLTGESYTYGDRGQPIPCEWCDSDLDYEGNSSEEDDYGISIGGTPEKRKRNENGLRGRLRSEKQWALD